MPGYMGQPSQPTTIPQVWGGNGQQQPSTYVRPAMAMPPVNQGYPYDGSYAQPQMPSPQMSAMEFVESREAAEAYRRPPNWPPNTPIPLWDGEHGYVYFKSWSPIGMANPLVRAKVLFDMEEPQQPAIPVQGSGASDPQQNYATKADFEQLEQKMMGMLQRMMPQQPQMTPQNQNGNNQGRNGSGKNG